MAQPNITKNAFRDGLFLSLPVGYFVTTVYAQFADGLELNNFKGFDPWVLWFKSPFVVGEWSDVFINCLQIWAGVMVALVLIFLLAGQSKRVQHHGTARWATFSEMAQVGYIKPYDKIFGPIFGKTTSPKSAGKYLSYGDMPHSMVVAPTRAGKGVGVVVPTLLTFDGSVLALDVKGELFEMTSRARKARGDRIFKFSPLDPQGRTHSYNPVMDVARCAPERQFLEARRLATNLIVAKGTGSEGFIDGARDLFVAGLLYCIEKGNPTIGAVYDLFALPGEKYKLFSYLAEQSNVPEVKRIFHNMASNDTKIITSYTSVLGDGGLNLWADQLIKNATADSDFSIYDLRRDPTSIYIVVSPNDLLVIAPLVRLFFQQVVSVLQRDLPTKKETFEVLFLLDEFKHLGKLEAIETAITTIAGYKGRFMFIIQSLSALTANYEQEGKENFLGNCGVQVFMATADAETPEYISKAIGDYTYTSKSNSRDIIKPLSGNISQQAQGAPLIRPEQIRLLDDDTQIVLIKGKPPMKMPKVKFYADKILKKLFEAQTGPLPEPPVKISKPALAIPMGDAAKPAQAPGPVAAAAPKPQAPAAPAPAPVAPPKPTSSGSAPMADVRSPAASAPKPAAQVAVPGDAATQAAKDQKSMENLLQQKALLERIIHLQKQTRADGI